METNMLFNDFFNILKESRLLEKAFDTGSQEYRLAKLWLDKLVGMQCHTVLDGEIRKSYMSQLRACISQRRLYGIFEQMPPATLEWMEFRDIAQQTVQRTTNCQHAGAMRDTGHTMQSQPHDERLEELTNPRPHTTSLQPFDMESESMGEAQQHMEQTMDAPFEYIYASTTSLEPYDMTRDSCNQCLGGSQRPLEDTLSKGIQYFDPRLASPSSNDSSCNMESRPLHYYMDRPQSMGGYRDQLKEDAMAERITVPDPSLSLPSSHEGPANMENLDFNQSMGGDQLPMEDAMDGSGEASSSRECLSLNESIEEFLHCMQRKMDEIGKHPDQSDVYPTSTTSMEPCEMTRRSISQSIDGDQQPTEIIPFLNPSSLDVDPCDMEYHVFDQPAGGEECLLEYNRNEGNQILEPALSSSLSDEDTFKVEYRYFHQSMGRDQHPMENTTDENITYFDASLSSRSPHKGSSNMESRTLKHFMDRAQHHLEQGTSLPPTSSRLEPSGMRCHFMDQSMGGYRDQLEEDAMAERIAIPDSSLSLPSSHEGPANMENRDFNQSMGGDQQPMEDAMDGSGEASSSRECLSLNESIEEFLHCMQRKMDEIGKHPDQSDAYPTSTTSMEPWEMTRRSISQSIDGDQQPTEVIPFLNPSSLDVDPCDMEYHVFDHPAGGEECLLEDNMNEGIQICEPALSSSLSDEDTCKVEYRDFYQSMGGDQHPMDTIGKRGESITFFDPNLSPPSPLEEELSDTELPSFRQYISRGVYLPDTTMGVGPPQFKKTTKDASQFDDLVHPAGIEKPMVSSQNVMQETLLRIEKIFKSANGATKSSLGCHPVGQSGMGKISFNQSTGGPQQLMQLMLGGAEQGDEKTNRAPQKLQKSPLEPQADMDMYPWVSMRRGISKSMSCPQIVILSTLEEPPKCHVNTKLEAQKLEKGSGPGTGPEPGKMEQHSLPVEQHSLPVERPKLLRHKTMDVTQQGDKNSKADAPTFKCPGPSGMSSYLWDSMGRALGKSASGLQMLMQNARDESLNAKSLNAVINGDFVTSDMVGRRHFGCLACLDASPKFNRQARDRARSDGPANRSTCWDGSHYPIPCPIAHEEASAGPAVTSSKERRTHKPDDEQRKDLLHILETVQGELRGAATVGHDDCLEKEMLRYRDWLIKSKERKFKKLMREGNAIAVRRYLLQSMEKDLLDLLK